MRLFSQILKPVASNGRNITLLHGWSMHHGVWQEVAPALLEQGFHVTLIDLPGHGSSNGLDNYSFEQQVQALSVCLPKQGIVLAWSLSGLFALRLAQQFPKQVQFLFMLAASPKFVRDNSWKHGMQASLLEDFALSLTQNMNQGLRRFLSLQVQGSHSVSQDMRTLRNMLKVAKTAKIEALQAGLHILSCQDLRQEVTRLQCPVHWIVGEKDQIIAARGIESLARNAGHSYDILPAAAHTPFISHPEIFLHSVLKRLESA